ncbi:MAG TPA: DUF4349 domain-containing protein [Actinomycetota bacterium]|nr:DUF4349 domain-containing protein [Actinomycetota bacterium]
MSQTRRRLVAGMLLGVLVIAAACGGTDEEGDGAGSAAMDAPQDSDAFQTRRSSLRSGEAGVSYTTTNDAVSAAGGGDQDSPATRAASIGPSVIKTAHIAVAVEDDELDGAMQDSIAIASRHGGFVLATNVDDRDARQARVTLRVPSRRFEMALADLRELGDVTAAEVRGEDVSQEFVDLEARLRNWRTQEAVLLRLMDEATTVSETIRVHGELSSVQLEIERIRGQLRYLEDQTSLGTITAKFSTDREPAAPPGTLRRAWEQALAGALDVVAGLIVASGFVIPIGALALFAWFLIRQVRVRLS